MTEIRPRNDESTSQATLDGDTIDEEREGIPRNGRAAVLWKVGQQLDDPDPVRVAKWCVRLEEEGMLE